MSTNGDDDDVKKYFDNNDFPEVRGRHWNNARSATQEEYYHKYKSGPQSVENFLSSELLNMSHNDRNATLEEAHGVRCLAPEETPKLIKEALYKLAIELDKLPVHKKRGYLESQQTQEQNATVFPNGITTRPTYVNTDEFRLRILRADLFDAPKAATRMANYLDVAWNLFGRYALFRPVKLSDFTKIELRVIRQGIAQFLPFRDRYGRRVLVVFMNEQLEEISLAMRMKICFYFTDAASRGDLESQRKGAVGLMWCQEAVKYKFKVTPANTHLQLHEFIPIRMSAVHVCTPDTPFYRIARSMFAISFGRDHLSRMRFHIGQPIENRYALESHGISMDQMPITWTGKLKQQYVKQWMRVREVLEEGDSSSSDVSKANASHHTKQIVECPQLSDVIFRQGTDVMHHPGNVMFRSRIQALYEEAKTQTMSRTTKTMAIALIQEIRSNKGRVLIWHQSKDKGTWTELTDKEQIYNKIENMVRSFKYSKSKYQAINRSHPTTHSSNSGSSSNIQNTKSNTSLFLQSSQEDGCCANTRGRKRAYESSDDDSYGDQCFCRL